MRGFDGFEGFFLVFVFVIVLRPSTLVLRPSSFDLRPSTFDLSPHKKTPASVGLQEHIDGIVKLFT